MKKAEKAKLLSKLRKSSVGIAGAGGLGSNVAMALARAGVGHLVIIDFDVVEEGNLTRQYYFLDQVGKPKVTALKKNVERATKGTKVNAVKKMLLPGKMAEPFRGVDVVVEALDKAETKTMFVKEILTALPGKPLVAASGVAGWGACERLELKKFATLFLVRDERARSSDDGVLLAPKVCVMANMQANVVLEILLGVENVH
ncbi:MAG: sulfur carrier protein ThiS adenylyltransferase ThiF [Euryarchaeota archaeon]|nr:sulfur carrier protein ThiS adenylyltransferase ThiF [Euryarchaeota archaeon]